MSVRLCSTVILQNSFSAPRCWFSKRTLGINTCVPTYFLQLAVWYVLISVQTFRPNNGVTWRTQKVAWLAIYNAFFQWRVVLRYVEEHLLQVCHNIKTLVFWMKVRCATKSSTTPWQGDFTDFECASCGSNLQYMFSLLQHLSFKANSCFLCDLQ